MLWGHLTRVIYHQVYSYTQKMASLVLPRQTRPPSGLQMNFLNNSNPINKASPTSPYNLQLFSFAFPLQVANSPFATCIQFSLCNLLHGLGNALACQDISLGNDTNILLPGAILPGAIPLLNDRGHVFRNKMQVTPRGYLQKVLAEVRVAAAGCIPPCTARPPLGMHFTPTPPWLRLVPCRPIPRS